VRVLILVLTLILIRYIIIYLYCAHLWVQTNHHGSDGVCAVAMDTAAVVSQFFDTCVEDGEVLQECYINQRFIFHTQDAMCVRGA
jgi:hypothetical protein